MRQRLYHKSLKERSLLGIGIVFIILKMAFVPVMTIGESVL